METSGLDPEITICKIAVLPIKLYPLSTFKLSNFKLYLVLIIIIYQYILSIVLFYPRNDLNVHELKSIKLKLILSTNSSTRTT
jgi:hypothetical protein